MGNVFVADAEKIAEAAMLKICPELVPVYSSLIKFLCVEPGAASKPRGKKAPSIGSREYVINQAKVFYESRLPKGPKPPNTIPDEMVSLILHEYFDVPSNELENAKQQHLLSMGAENLVGDLLERYLASVLEPLGWVWCSGAMVKAVDFVKPPQEQVGSWRMLQVKNRDNSENSSSSAIRKGTDIEKWHRTFSKKVATNWDAFPDVNLKKNLSEDGFKSFVKSYLESIRDS